MLKRSFFAALLIATPALAEMPAPLDGTWTVRTVETEMGEKCPSFFAPMAEQMAASLGRRDTYDITWGGTFDPNTAQGIDPDNQGVVWVAQDDGSWTANLAGADKDYVVATMRQVSETEIANRVDMDIERMMEAEGGALPGVEGCTLNMSFAMQYKG